MSYPRNRKAVAGLCALLFAASSPAAEYIWSGGSGGAGEAWRQANNWSPAAGQGGPGVGDLAIFSTNGTAPAIGIKFNDGLGLTTTVAAIALSAGPDRTIFNSSPNSSGTLRLDGWRGNLLANDSASSVLTLNNGADSTMSVLLASGGAIRVTSATAGIVLASQVAGTNGLVKTGAGWLQLRHSNSLSGNVIVSGGTLELAAVAGSALGSVNSLRLESGAVAKLSAPEQIGDGTSIDLAGGTLRGAVGAVAVTEKTGALTLTDSSTIDLGASSIHMGDSSPIIWNPSATLTITNWRGVTSGSGGRLFFGIGGLTSAQLAQIYFADLGVRGAQLLGPQGELSPIPEAPVTAGAAALAAFILWRERRRLRRAMSHMFVPRSGASASKADKCHSAD